MKTDDLKQERQCAIHDVRHSALWWFFRNPIKLIQYYIKLERIDKANKGNDYDYPELNWYMRN